MTKLQQDMFHSVALSVAEDANENHFGSRSGVYLLTCPDGVELLAVYNNNPWSQTFSDGVCSKRESDHAEFAVAMSTKGIEELSRACYPATGASAGYTTAIVLNADCHRFREVADAYRAAIKTGHPDSIQSLEVNFANDVSG
jgi:hypothetical protein